MALFRNDEELGKKDDEYRPGPGRLWRNRRLSQLPPRRSLKRLSLAVLAVLAVIYFFKHVMREDERDELRSLDEVWQRPKSMSDRTTTTKPARPVSTAPVQRDFNGPIRFLDLAASLHVAGKLMGSNPYNQNVLFAAASLKSATFLLPIACEMAIQERNEVHFAFLGRDDIPMDMLKAVNGIGKECKIMFHDARPDFTAQSTDFRMEVSCNAAFNHINTFVHPQATIIDGSDQEEQYFLRGIKDRALSLDKPIIELPHNAEQSLMWITQLDSSSLAAWNKVSFDLIVHAQSSASGSLIRLLESLKKADYFTSALPRLTIELPHDIDPPTKSYLRSRFKWPPKSDSHHGNLLTLRHRIPQAGLTVEENSIRFLESFWPSNPTNSHVLVLSPQAELSPLFFHYLKYAVLGYKYSIRQFEASQILGISLDLPQTYLNGTSTFKAPLVKGFQTSFLWEAPNSNALLLFGERWVELHDFVSKSLASQHRAKTPFTLSSVQVSKHYPSWLVHIVRFARARGYTTVYPGFESKESLVTIHSDLYKVPEEHKKASETKPKGELGASVKDYIKAHKESKNVNSGFMTFIGDDGRLPPLSDLTLLTFDGKTVEWPDLDAATTSYIAEFRKEIGGCGEKDEVAPRVLEAVDDLFCLDKKFEHP